MRKHEVSRGLSLPRQMGGADRGLAIFNGTLTALLVNGGEKVPLNGGGPL